MCHYEVAGLERRHWSGAGPIRTVFRQAFTAAELPYFNPHSFRDTLTALGMKRCKDAEALKAWSQNLGHSVVMTTLLNYGEVDPQRQAEIMQDLAAPAPASRVAGMDVEAVAHAMLRMVGASHSPV